MKRQPKYGIILFALLAVAAFLPMLQGWFHWFPTKPLNGVTEEIDKPTFELDAYRSGEFAKEAEAYTSRHFGFREPIIRLYNQYLWNFYHKTYAHDIVAGKEGWLYYPQSVRDYYGQELLRWHSSVDEARQKFDNEVKYMNWARSILKENDVDLLVFMAPEKSFLYPEFLPDGEKDTTAFNACDYFAQRFEETGFPCIEMTRWFQQIKDTVDYPLIPQAGAHWIFPSVYAVDTLSCLMGDLKGIELPKIKIGEAHQTRERDHDYDNDLEALLNLAFPMKHQYGYCPRHYVSIEQDSTSVKPKVLFIGNSYFWAMNLFAPFDKMFETTEFWYYFSTAYSGDSLTETTSVNQLDFVEKLMDLDYVVWFTTGNQMNKGTSDFAEIAILNLCYSKKDIGLAYNRIIDSLALTTFGAPIIDSNDRQPLWNVANQIVNDHPERYFPELASDSLPTIRNPKIREILTLKEIQKHPDKMEQLVTDMVKELKSKPVLMQQIEEKAIKNGKSLEEQTVIDARWIITDKINRGVISLE